MVLPTLFCANRDSLVFPFLVSGPEPGKSADDDELNLEAGSVVPGCLNVQKRLLDASSGASQGDIDPLCWHLRHNGNSCRVAAIYGTRNTGVSLVSCFLPISPFLVCLYIERKRQPSGGVDVMN
jgi:hypothetical protein